MKDFFISYNQADRAWAEWIAWTLEEAGYSVVIDAWDFRPGSNWVENMHRAVASTKKTILVLSQNYLKAQYTFPEWAAAFVADPRGHGRKMVPFRVADCQPEGLLKQVQAVDLFSLVEEEAVKAVRGALMGRGKPRQAPPFPEGPASAVGERRSIRYPGREVSASATPEVRSSPRNPLEIQHLRALSEIKRRRLRVLEKQAATYGFNAPPHVVTEIDELRREIRDLEAKL